MSVTPHRILLLADEPSLSGVSTYMLSICAAFRENPNFKLSIAAFPGRDGHPFLVSRAAAAGLNCHIFPMTGPFDIRVLRQLRRYVRANAIQLIHTQDYRGNVICRLAGARVPVVNTFHAHFVMPTRRQRLREWASLQAMKSHRATITLSESMRVWLLNHGIDPRRVHTIHGAVPEPIPSGRPSLRAAFDDDGERLVVLYAGRMVAGKGLEWFLPALRDVRNVTALIAGDGPLLDNFKNKAAGVDARFFGRVDDLAPFYEAADVVALPSAMEGLPMTLLEATAHGKPIVATRVGGISEIVRDGENGFLIQYNAPVQLIEALKRLREKKLREKMAERSRHIWREKFTPAKMAEKLANVYTNAINPPAA